MRIDIVSYFVGCRMEHFSYIPFVPDKKIVMRRMGVFKAQFSGEIDSVLDAYFKEAQTAFKVAGKAQEFSLIHSDNGVEIAGAFVESASLSKLLRFSKRIYIMCAAMPSRDVGKINETMQNGKALKAVVLDAYASEYVDGALDVIMSRKNELLRRAGEKLTKHRFSAGYADLDIKYQKLFFDMIDMGTLFVTINENYLLSPEKSVIAVAGVE